MVGTIAIFINCLAEPLRRAVVRLSLRGSGLTALGSRRNGGLGGRLRCVLVGLGEAVSSESHRGLMDAVGNDAKHDNDCPEQPHDHPDVLPRVSDVVVCAAAVLVLLSVREEGQQDDQADTDHCEQHWCFPLNLR